MEGFVTANRRKQQQQRRMRSENFKSLSRVVHKAYQSFTRSWPGEPTVLQPCVNDSLRYVTLHAVESRFSRMTLAIRPFLVSALQTENPPATEWRLECRSRSQRIFRPHLTGFDSKISLTKPTDFRPIRRRPWWKTPLFRVISINPPDGWNSFLSHYNGLNIFPGTPFLSPLGTKRL